MISNKKVEFIVVSTLGATRSVNHTNDFVAAFFMSRSSLTPQLTFLHSVPSCELVIADG